MPGSRSAIRNCEPSCNYFSWLRCTVLLACMINVGNEFALISVNTPIILLTTEEVNEPLPVNRHVHSTIPANKRTEGSYVAIDQDAQFHVPAYTKIKNLVTDTSMMSWGLKKTKGLGDELRVKYLQLPIARLHTMSDDEKQQIWSNVSQHYVWESKICDGINGFERAGSVKPHILFSRCDENVGDFSRYVPEKKTTNWDRSVVFTAANGCQSDEAVFRYLNHSNVKAVFTTQHHFLDHPKLHSLPLGIKHTMKYDVLRALREPRVPKVKLLMINDNGWKHRKNVTRAVIRNFSEFNVSLKNSYSNRKSRQYIEELRKSKFILAPSGLGWDCYRIWEAIHFNTIPVVERYYRPHDGWRRTLDDLPVLWVEDFRNLTPGILRTEYQRIVSKGAEYYNFEKLTRAWWADFIRSKLSE